MSSTIPPEEREREELRREIQIGIDQLDRGKGIVLNDEKALEEFFEDIKKRGRQRLEEKGRTNRHG